MVSGLNIPSYTLPSGVTLTNAYGVNVGVGFDLTNGSGRIALNVYASQTASANGLPPVDQIPLSLGQVIVPASGTTPAVVASTLPELLARVASGVTTSNPPTGQDAYNILAYLFLTEHLKNPKLAGSTLV